MAFVGSARSPSVSSLVALADGKRIVGDGCGWAWAISCSATAGDRANVGICWRTLINQDSLPVDRLDSGR